MHGGATASQQPQWPTKGAFLLVAFSAGLSGLLRLPMVAYHYGGAAFLYPFLICLFLLATPVLILELALGQVFQAVLLPAIQKVHPAFRGLGYYVAPLAALLSVCTLLPAAWAVFLTTEGMAGGLPAEVRWQAYPASEPPLPSPAAFNGWLLLAVVVQWTGVGLALCKGVTWLSRAAYGAVPFVTAMLIALLAWALARPGAAAGAVFAVSPDPQHWASVDLWMAALAQSFLSLGLGSGLMPSVGARNHKTRDLCKWGAIVSLAVACLSVLCVLLVFALLGSRNALQPPEGTPPTLALLPLELRHLCDGLPPLPAAGLRSLIYLTVYGAGVVAVWGHGFALVQAVHVHFPNLPDGLTALAVCLLGLIISLPFTFGVGCRLIESLNYFLPNFCVPMVVLVECVAVGYFFDVTPLRQRVRERSHKRWRRLLDYAALGLYYSVVLMQQQINQLQKTQVSRPIWCTLVKYVVPCLSILLVVTELVFYLCNKPGLLLPSDAPWYSAVVGWGALILLPICLLAGGLCTPRPEGEEEGAWSRAADVDSPDPDEMEFELDLPEGL